MNQLAKPGKDKVFPKRRTLLLNGQLKTLERPWVMGILNLTEDSFWRPATAVNPAEDPALYIPFLESMAPHCDIIDIGAVSTRPGAAGIPEEKEMEIIGRVLPVLKKACPSVFYSVDTWRSKVARLAADLGASMINDVSAGSMDAEMFRTMGEIHLPYVLMHMQGRPETMQLSPQYGDVVSEISLFFAEKLLLLEAAGVHDIILDPGFGFGKTKEHNFELLNRLDEFLIFGRPVLAGLSRKSMIQKALGVTAEQALNGTTVLNTLALLKGADILRVHDPAEARQAIRLLSETDSLSLQTP